MESPEIEKIVRFLSNDLSEVEQRAVRDWINASRENQLEFNRIADIWAAYKKDQKVNVDIASDWRVILRRIDAELEPSSWWKNASQTWIYRTAAVLLIGLTIWAIKPLRFFSPVELIYISTQKNDLLLLEDSSRVWLTRNSKLTYPERFVGRTREVMLEGEAFFEVKGNPAKPFIIHTQGTSTQVLGTSFLIKSNADVDSISVSVVTGKVRFTAGQKELIMTEGDGASLNKKTRRMYKFRSDFNDVAWHTHELQFDRTRLENVVRYLKEVYTTNFQVDKALLKCRFTGYYKNEGLDQILGDMELTLQMTIEHDRVNNKIILHGKGC